MAASLPIASYRPFHPADASSDASQLPEFAGVFRGRELTHKERRLASGLIPLDTLIGGGIVRGRIIEIVGPAGCGKTSLAASFIAAATRRGETAAWIDLAGAFDPASAGASGIDLSRTLWVHPPTERAGYLVKNAVEKSFQRAIALVLEAGGFGVVVADFGNGARALPPSTALRIARLAERAGTAVIVLGSHRICGTFAALSLALDCNRACFSRAVLGAPALFDGFMVEARVARNKLGGVGAHANLRALIDPLAGTVAPAGACPRGFRRTPVLFWPPSHPHRAGRDARPSWRNKIAGGDAIFSGEGARRDGCLLSQPS